MILWRISNKELVDDKIYLDRNLPAQDDPEEQERGRKRNVSSSNLNGAIPGPSKRKRSLSPPNITDLAGSKVAAAEACKGGGSSVYICITGEYVSLYRITWG